MTTYAAADPPPLADLYDPATAEAADRIYSLTPAERHRGPEFRRRISAYQTAAEETGRRTSQDEAIAYARHRTVGDQPNVGYYKRTTPDGWEVYLVDFIRSWEAPDLRTGRGQTVRGVVLRRRGRPDRTADLTLTSDMFGSPLTGRPAASAVLTPSPPPGWGRADEIRARIPSDLG